MSFRYAGTAWDGQPWRTAAAITTLGQQTETLRPGSYPADGTVASRIHDEQNPDSDHTVWPKTGPGVVYAIDIGEPDPSFIDVMLEQIRQSEDERCKYAIHAGLMFSSYPTADYPAFTWRPYSGYNAHLGHGHLSVWHDQRGEDSRPWQIGEEMVDRNSKADEGLAGLKANFDEAVSKGIMSAQTQPGGVAFNDEFATFLKRAGVFELNELIARVASLESQTPGAHHDHDGRYLKDVTPVK